MRKSSFVAVLYLLAGSMFLIGGGELYQKLEFRISGEDAVMKAADPMIAKSAKFSPGEPMRATVVYETAKGALTVPDKRLTGDQVRQLARGEGLRVKFLRGEPQRTLADGETMPSGGIWLGIGAGALCLALYAHFLLRREARAAA